MNPGGGLGRVENLVAVYGYLAVFFGLMAENAGIPIPGETILLIAGFYSHRGQLFFPVVVVLGILGAVTGDNISYWIGRRGGRPLLDRYGKRFHVPPARVAAAEKFFEDHGTKAVFLQRWIAGVRMVGAMIAGASHMPWGQFLLFNFLGAATWVLLITSLGYLFSQQLERIGTLLGRVGLALVIAIILGGAAVYFKRWLRTRTPRNSTRPSDS